MNHMPYDEGAVAEAFQVVLGIMPLTKTTKTMCGKRVLVSQADYKADTTCDLCNVKIAEKVVRERRLREALGLAAIGGAA